MSNDLPKGFLLWKNSRVPLHISNRTPIKVFFLSNLRPYADRSPLWCLTPITRNNTMFNKIILKTFELIKYA
jgi:hypothetical protein